MAAACVTVTGSALMAVSLGKTVGVWGFRMRRRRVKVLTVEVIVTFDIHVLCMGKIVMLNMLLWLKLISKGNKIPLFTQRLILQNNCYRLIDYLVG